MSRRHRAEKREVLPDPKFGDVVLTKFMNVLMYAGMKSVAEGIVYGALDRVQQRSSQDPIRVFHDALGNVKPDIEVRSRRVGGGVHQLVGQAFGHGEFGARARSADQPADGECLAAVENRAVP